VRPCKQQHSRMARNARGGPNPVTSCNSATVTVTVVQPCLIAAGQPVIGNRCSARLAEPKLGQPTRVMSIALMAQRACGRRAVQAKSDHHLTVKYGEFNPPWAALPLRSATALASLHLIPVLSKLSCICFSYTLIKNAITKV